MGSTSSETQPSIPCVRSQTGASRSHASRMSSCARAMKSSVVSSVCATFAAEGRYLSRLEKVEELEKLVDA